MTFQRCARYSPDKLLFICDTQEQADQLEARGWTALPADYAPGDAVWVPHWGSLTLDEPKAPEVFDRKEPPVPDEVKPPKKKK